MNQENTSSYQSQMKLAMRELVQAVMDIEVSQMLAANRYERNASRRAYRNGYRTSLWETSIGQIELRIPKLRRGTYYPHRLLNDTDVVDGLITLVHKCVTQGIESHDLRNTIDALNLVTVSTYELHQIYEAIHPYSAQTFFTPSLSRRLASDMPDKVQIIVQKRSADGQLQIQNHTEVNTDNKEFWREFTRRMQHRGYNVEDYQSVLSTINPYAVIDESDSIDRHNFDNLMDSLYRHQYKLIA